MGEIDLPPSAAEVPASLASESAIPAEYIDLMRDIEHAAHLLPTQGPITVFVHHNTLHAFEELPFETAVLEANRTYGCEPYLSEARYRRELEAGRIRPHDLHSVLLDDLNDQGDVLIGCLGTRHELQLAMLRYPLFDGSNAEIRWFIDEADALYRFREDVTPAARRRLKESTRHWIQRDLLTRSSPVLLHISEDILGLLKKFDATRIENWSDHAWETLTLHLLWQFSRQGVSHANNETVSHEPVRPRDVLLKLTGEDADQLVNPELIRFCAAYLDQGYAGWQLPNRELGFLEAYGSLVCDTHPVKEWLHELPLELTKLRKTSPLASIGESLELLAVGVAERQEFLTQTMLALKGWAGMIWQMETNGEWLLRKARENTLVEFLAIRLILDRLAAEHLARTKLGFGGNLSQLRTKASSTVTAESLVKQRAFQVFQIAQLRGWSPAELNRLSPREWRQLIDEIESFDSRRRRRIYHLAYERRYRVQTLDAVSTFAKRRSRDSTGATHQKAYQVICCLDDREESFRRHLEEVDPEAETFGVAGFFGVAMYYRGATEAHFKPLCPIVMKPRHYVVEEPVFSTDGSLNLQESMRRRTGRFIHEIHLQTRTAAGGFVTGLLGPLSSLPLVLRILFPRLAARMSGLFRRVVTPPSTQLCLVRSSHEPGPGKEQLGYTTDEMAQIVGNVLRSIGLTEHFAPMVFVVGHGSGSLNNPHEAAYDCGACGGGPGGPNARAFAAMANDPRVRSLLAEGGLRIPADVLFIGCFHNTCDDGLEYYDVGRLADAKWKLFTRARAAFDKARGRNAHERCRKFESAPFSLSSHGALRHSENRSEDLSQVRPEYCHATNAVCFVGRRARTRGLFMDRRAFLTSYDPTTDDAEHSVLAGILAAVVPVCAGINLEYYFSAVDTSGYGCGSKLPHNLTSLVGVMEGAESDLRTGLSAQMVEIHEPQRLLFIIEATPQAMIDIIDRDSMISRLVHNRWVQLSVLDPHGDQVQFFHEGRFQAHVVEDDELPRVGSSSQWYRGWRKPLGFAEIALDSSSSKTSEAAMR